MRRELLHRPELVLSPGGGTQARVTRGGLPKTSEGITRSDRRGFAYALVVEMQVAAILDSEAESAISIAG